MAVNEVYFGAVGTWATATTESLNQQFEFKVANFNPSDSTIGKGDYKYKFGELFNQTGEYVIDLDISTAYCAMDKDAPFVHRLYTSARYDSTRYHSRIDLAPTKDTPIGWYAGSIPTYMVILPEGYATDLAPVNFKPLWEDPAWHPTISTSNGQRTLGYIGSANTPVLSFPYKNIKLVPVVRCCAFKADKTKTDLDNAVTYTDFASVVDLTTEKFVPLGTYANDSYSGTPFYEAFPVICSLYVAPVLLYFDNNGDLAVPPSCSSKYNSTAMRSYGSMRETLHVDIFPADKVDFTELISRFGTVYSDASCDARLFPTDRMPATYVYYSYNGNSYPQKSIAVYEQGAFCIGGRCVRSAGNYNFMYIRAIDPDTFKVYADTDDADIDCGVTVEGFGTLDDFVEYVRKSVAYFGMFFTDDVEPAVEEKSTMDTAGLHLGIIDSSGITHGAYTTGTQNPTAPNYGWTDPVNDTPWTPGGGGDDDSELPSDPNLYNSMTSSGFGIALKYYALRRTDLDDLYAWVYQYMDYSLAVVAATAAGDPYESEFHRLYPDAAAWHAYVCDRAGHGVYPTDNIVGIMAYPFDLTGSAAGYRMGAWDTSQVYNHFDLVPGAQTLTGLAVTGDGYKIISLGSGAVEFAGLHGDYRDTAPYTRIDLQIPYHGTVALEPGVWIGHTLTVEAVVDLMCGSSVAVILRDGAPMMTVPGQMGISVPITRDNVSQTANTFMAQSNAYQSSVLGAVSGFAQGVLRYVGGAAGAVSAGLTGDLPGVVTGALGTIAGGWGTLTAARQEQIQIRQQQYDMQHIVTGRMVSGGGSPACNAKLGTRCRLVWHYPRELPGSNAADYPAIAGHACSCTDVIGAFTGFVQFGAVDLSGLSCTDTEKAVILQALQAGVYI